MLSENSEIAIELLENSPDAMMALSPKGIIVYWNKRIESLPGKGTTVRIVLPATETGAAKRG
ncbi:MAG: PAS domain-containing protein [Pyrinomonadaceae bacterium]